MSVKPLIKGDKVVMHTCMEAEWHNAGLNRKRRMIFINKLNIYPNTYCEIEKRLGLLTDDNLNELLIRLTYIAANRHNAGMVGSDILDHIVKLFKCLKIERDRDYGNTLTIKDLEVINIKVFNGESNKTEIKHWLLRDMLNDLAAMIDEGYRYGLGTESDDDTKLLIDFLFYLNMIYLRLQ